MVEVRVSRLTGRMTLGLIVIALGTMWTLDNLGLIESEPILRWWPTLLIAFGVAKLFGIGTYRHLAAGAVFTLLGVWLLAGGLGIRGLDLSLMWPLILVVVGVLLVFRSRRAPQVAGPGEDQSSRVNTFSFWSGCTRKISSQSFRGGEVTAVMGGAKLDLRQARPVPEGAVIDVFIWWGGIELLIPEDMKVVLEGNVLMGGIEDRSKAPPADSAKTLILRGVVLMGGIDIRN
ncbi:MAG: hypothetical protein E6K80_14810 [Candidatus Eisenbacteria bacterium]|uniref:LiaF transmembrane domain-containing protein n=1 Tax=Eiseniibacteriota bacterium TaxID=2212470 RepID=A0A538TW77_UNCEI|nr:MAG: hypothetical protein E6K80_14810 [Candidatus Eisenbacteria bacterium]